MLVEITTIHFNVFFRKLYSKFLRITCEIFVIGDVKIYADTMLFRFTIK